MLASEMDGSAPQFQLLIADGPAKGTFIPLPEGDLVVGRSPTCGVTLAHNQVAPTHCGLRVRSDQVIVAPGGTVNVTTLNGQRLAKAQLLRVGDLLGIGPYRLRLQLAEEPENPRFRVGDRVGPYLLTGELGSGAVGRVFEAEDAAGRQVALKVLRMRVGMTPRETEHRRSLFKREAASLEAIEHPNVVRSCGSGEHDGVPWLAMEFLQGPTLREMLIGGRLDLPVIERIMFQLCSAVAAVHEAGVIHRDLKPANILLVGREPRVVLADFGLAQPQGAPRLEELDPPHFSTAIRVGQQVGTPAYMPPEQTKGQAADQRSDVWSLGAMLYEVLSGERPFPGHDVRTVLTKVVRECPEPLPDDLEPYLRGIVYKCLQKRPEWRFRDAVELVEALHDRLLVQLLPVGSEGPVRPPLTGCPHCGHPVEHPLTCPGCLKPIFRYTDGQVLTLPVAGQVLLACGNCGATVGLNSSTCSTCGMVYSDLPPVGYTRSAMVLGTGGTVVVDIFDQAVQLLERCPYCNAQREDDGPRCHHCSFAFRPYVASRLKLDMVVGGWAISCADCGAPVDGPDEPHCPQCGLNFNSGMFPDGTRFPDELPGYLKRKLKTEG